MKIKYLTREIDEGWVVAWESEWTEPGNNGPRPMWDYGTIQHKPAKTESQAWKNAVGYLVDCLNKIHDQSNVI